MWQPRPPLLPEKGTVHLAHPLSLRVCMCMCSRGEFGRLGHGDTKGRLSPTKVDSLARVDVVAVSAGGRYVCVSTMSAQGKVGVSC